MNLTPFYARRGQVTRQSLAGARDGGGTGRHFAERGAHPKRKVGSAHPRGLLSSLACEEEPGEGGREEEEGEELAFRRAQGEKHESDGEEKAEDVVNALPKRGEIGFTWGGATGLVVEGARHGLAARVRG